MAIPTNNQTPTAVDGKLTLPCEVVDIYNGEPS
jgi:hypothetical protein